MFYRILQKNKELNTYDNDEAGRKATKKVAESLAKVEVTVKVLSWPKDRETGHHVTDEVLKSVDSLKRLIKVAPEWEAPKQGNGNAQTDFKTPPGPKPQPEPKISDEAFHGLAGDIVRMIKPHTEADPVGLLVSILAEFGAIIGRKPHLILDASYHPLLFYPVIVGNSSKSRKGSSGKRIEALFKKAYPDWTRGPSKGTLSTGEGLCFAVRDEVWEKNKKGKDILSDEGVQDKRLFLVQSEFGMVLKIMSREGNSLSGTLRDAWDGEDLAPMTKGSRTRSTSPHIVILGHVTRDELLRNLNATEASNGFGNRFAWFHVKRSKILAFPGSPETSEQNKMVACLREALAYSKDVDKITLSESVKDLWRAVYPDLSRDRPGLSGSLLNRSEAYVMRLSAIYALLDCKGMY